jgi:hemophore-related protein
MKLFGCTARGFAISTCGGAVIGAAFLATPLAHADQDPNANLPSCSAADLEGVRAGVSDATSSYLFAHPDVNSFFTGLAGVPRDKLLVKVSSYMDNHPQTKAELTGIRQPLIDIKQRCGVPPSP